jgi:hypothetical protein
MERELTPDELRELAQNCRRDADEIQTGPVSHMAFDAVCSLRREAEGYERAANEIEAAIATQDRSDIGNAEMLAADARAKHDLMRDVEVAWCRAYVNKVVCSDEFTAYETARKTYYTAVAKLLIATGKC